MSKLDDAVRTALTEAGLGGVHTLAREVLVRVVAEEVDRRVEPLAAALRDLGYDVVRRDAVEPDGTTRQPHAKAAVGPTYSGRAPTGTNHEVLDAVDRHGPRPVARRTILRELRPPGLDSRGRDKSDSKYSKAVSRLVALGLLEISKENELSRLG